MAAVLSESVLDQNGPKWSKRLFWSKWPYSEQDFSIRETRILGPFWPILVHVRSANRTLAIPEQNKGTRGVQASYGAELPPIISIVRYPGRPVISVLFDNWGGPRALGTSPPLAQTIF